MALALCTTCFEFTDLLKRGTQRCNCEERIPINLGILDCPSGLHLCWICARTVAGGESRYSWEACEKCRAANSSLERKLGLKVPLGRHSVMNGVSIPIQKKVEPDDPSLVEMVGFIKKIGDLSEWGKNLTKVLYESVPAWAGLTHVSLEGWEKKFPSTSKASFEALQRYWGL